MKFINSLLAAAAAAVALPALAVQPVVTQATITFDEAALISAGPSIGSFYQHINVNTGVVFSDTALVLGDGIADVLADGTQVHFYTNAPTQAGVMFVDPNAATGTTVLTPGAGLSFVNEVSFYYSATADTLPAVAVYAGANGTGKRLARLPLLENISDSGCTDSAYCNWQKVSISFTGRAQSIVFASNGGQIAYDNLTISTVPEPESYALMLAGLVGVGFLARRRRA